jgi:hypothetical protein
LAIANADEWAGEGGIKLKKMKLPKDISKPFFSYGIFRPGEIAFQIISDYVDLNRIENKIIMGSLKLRDGILIFDQNGKDSVQGYLLFFKEGAESSAYESIVNVEPGNYYKWDEDQSKFKNQFNILHGKTVDKGIDEEKGFNSPNIWNNLFDSIWNDPFIINGFNMLEHYAKESPRLHKKYEQLKWEDEGIFNDYLKYQMLYLFLSSILERIMFLNGGFGKNPNKQVTLFSKDKTLHNVFDKLVLNDDFPQFKESFERKINAANNPTSDASWTYETNSNVNYEEAMKYYYQLRSNIIHRGKSGIKKLIVLRESFEELKFILSTFWEEKKAESKKIKATIDFLITQRNERN